MEVDCIISYTDSKEYADLTPKELLSTREFYMLWLIMFFVTSAVNMVSTMYKAFGQTFIHHGDHFLAMVGSVAAIFNSGGRVMWGTIMDKTSFKPCMQVMQLLLTALFLSLLLVEWGGRLLFPVWIWCIYLTFCGTFSMVPSITSQMFGP